MGGETMAFETLLGNEQLKKNLQNSISGGHISHFYLISGPEGSGKHTLARLIAAAAVCEGDHRPCCSCNPCRKILSGIHPDFITVDDPEKKTVSVDLIRQAKADIYVRPNEGKRKIYLLPRAQDMRIEAQNALLKVLEEPPSYGLFLLLTDNPEKLLPTIRSRCVELKLTALPENVLRSALTGEFPKADEAAITGAIHRSGGFFGQAKAILSGDLELAPQTESFAAAFASGSALGLTQVLTPMEKLKRDALLEILEQWHGILVQALSHRAGVPAANPLAEKISVARLPKDILAAANAIRTCIDYVQGNISPAAICGYLTWELR
jgi:DNA polymerase-3 subunit delta'